MKKLSLLLLFTALWTACTNEIGTIPNDEPKKLIINAILNAANTENAIYLNLSDYSTPDIVKDGTIRLYVNGELTETINECKQRSREEIIPMYTEFYYPVNTRFQIGDRIRIEAETKDGRYKAEAETGVYEPLKIVSLDTMHISYAPPSVTGSNYPGWLNEYTRLKVKLEAPASNERQYHRVQLQQDYTYYLVNKETQKDSIVNATYWGCTYYYDTALMDGKPGNPTNTDSSIDFIPSQENYYQVFSDIFFTDRQYTMTLDVFTSYYWDTETYDIRKTTCYATLQFSSISGNEYRYLRAVSAYGDHDRSNPLENPIIFPNNIKGGIGIFAVENATEYKFEIKR